MNDNPSSKVDLGISSIVLRASPDDHATGVIEAKLCSQDFMANETTSKPITEVLEFESNTTLLYGSTAGTNVNETTNEWKADDFERDCRILKHAIAQHQSVSNLQQLQRKYTLDHGFALNRRPLITDALRMSTILFFQTALLIGFGAGGICTVSSMSWLRKPCLVVSSTILSIATLHYWIVVVSLPLFMLTCARYEEYNSRSNISKSPHTLSKRRFPKRWLLVNFGPSARILDTYFNDPHSERSVKKMRSEGTEDFVLCLLENWSSAVVGSFLWQLISIMGFFSLHGIRFDTKISIESLGRNACSGHFPLLSRLLTRLGAAAALNQFQHLLFELRREDQPRPLCRPTHLLRRSVQSLLGWLPFGVSCDLALLIGSRCRNSPDSRFSVEGLLLSLMGPVCHGIALFRLIKVSKCSALSTSLATSFPDSKDTPGREEAAINDTFNDPKKVIWRYELRWRKSHRLLKILRTWMVYLVTGHVPLLMQMDEWKEGLIRSDGFSTEGNRYESDELLLLHKDEISESLSLIFRDKDAAIVNATQARSDKHQQSYHAKDFDDVLGVAIQKTFGVGLSYDFDHFSLPSDDHEVSIHHLRARMAKSAIRQKIKLDNELYDELEVLNRLKYTLSDVDNLARAQNEAQLVERERHERYTRNIVRIKKLLLSLIPTDAMAPQGTENDGSTIMISEYVNVTAPVGRRDMKAAVLEAPDSLTMIEGYVRKEYGNEAADIFRRQENEARRKERNTPSSFRQKL